MRQLMVLSSVLGGGGALLGFCLAYRLDLPVGATDVAVLGLGYGLSLALRRILPSLARSTPDRPAK